MSLPAADLTRVGPLPPAAKLALAVEIARAYVRARRSLRREGLREALAELRGPGSPGGSAAAAPGGSAADSPGASPVAGARRLGRVVRRTLALLPGDTRCLSQSLVLTQLLAARGLDSRLVIGVRPGERFAAHAWLEHGGAPLLPPGAGEFEELVKL